jgi:hypothetical protein
MLALRPRPLAPPARAAAAPRARPPATFGPGGAAAGRAAAAGDDGAPLCRRASASSASFLSICLTPPPPPPPLQFPTAARPAARGPPAWKVRARSAERKLGRQAETTLEMLWTRTEWPSDDVIQSMWDLHRVRRDVVIDWFKARRSIVRRGGGGKGGGGEGGGEGGTDAGGEARPGGEAAEGEESGEGEAFR